MEFEFDGNLVLLDKVSDRLLLYNENAASLWTHVADRRRVEAMALALADRHSLPVGLIREDFEAVIADWRDKGLIRHVAGAHANDRRPIVEPPSAQISAARWDEIWTCEFRDLIVEFAFEKASRAAYARTLFGQQLCSPSKAATRIEVREGGGNWATIWQNGVERLRTDTPEEVNGALSQLILEHLHPGISWRTIIHAGAVAHDGVGIAFPASSGSGKTTLVAWLTGNGFHYLADDFVAVDSPRGMIIPWPVPLNVKQGSWDVLAAAQPGLADAPEYRTKGLTARLLPPPPGSWFQPPAPLEYLIFPRYRQGGTTALEKLAPVEALERLLRDRIWLGYPKTEASVGAFLAWVRSIDSYDLQYGDLQEAEQHIRAMIGR